MPIINHGSVPEVPWRQGYRKWDIVEPETGMSTNLSYSVAQVGTGAPLHKHEDDELIVILKGELEVRLGDETKVVGPEHTIAIPPNVEHGFTVVGASEATLLAFFPVPNPFDRTTYLEGAPPAQPGATPSISQGRPT